MKGMEITYINVSPIAMCNLQLGLKNELFSIFDVINY